MSLTNLLRILSFQMYDGVEILISVDNRAKSIGQKRNELMKAATGEYIVFLDDDDRVSDFYIIRVLDAIKESNADYIAYDSLFTFNGAVPKTIKTRIGHEWGEYGVVQWQGVRHTNPIRRSMALQADFPNISQAEDREWGRQMDNILKTQFIINEVLYFYDYNDKRNTSL